jgi:tetratricopeptide (TPR) repeat protein
VKLTCELNIAQCLLKLENYGEAIAHCNIALEIDPKSTKALFRRARAHSNVGKYDDARNDLSLLLDIDNQNREGLKELQSLNKKVKEHHKAQKKQFSGMFNRGRLYEDKDVVKDAVEEQQTDLMEKLATIGGDPDDSRSYYLVLLLIVLALLLFVLLAIHMLR